MGAGRLRYGLRLRERRAMKMKAAITNAAMLPNAIARECGNTSGNLPVEKLESKLGMVGAGK